MQWNGLFKCKDCGTEPEIILLDGIQVGIQLSRVEANSESSDCGRPWDSYATGSGKNLDLSPLRRRTPVKAPLPTDDCEKEFQSSTAKSGGLIVVLCPHGVVVSWTLVGYNESLRGVEAFLRNYRMCAPRVVIYDFACGLKVVALKQDAKFWETTTWVVDEFHRKSHKCNRQYAMTTYLKMVDDPLCRVLSTSLVESTNRKIRNLGRSMTYCGHLLAWDLTNAWMKALNATRILELDVIRRGQARLIGEEDLEQDVAVAVDDV